LQFSGDEHKGNHGGRHYLGAGDFDEAGVGPEPKTSSPNDVTLLGLA
jgi:hypothetical protein